MSSRQLKRTLTLAATLHGGALAGVAFDEALQGDLSNQRHAPTPVTLALGDNDVFGRTGRGASGVDLDYLSVTIGTGQHAALAQHRHIFCSLW